MFKASLLGAAFLAVLSMGAMAAVPEGKGSLNLGLGLGQESSLEEVGGGAVYYHAETPYQATLSGDAPIWSGLSAGLDLAASNSPYSLHTPGSAESENIANYAFGAELRAYPAAFMSRDFKPGDNANPDGWLLWPSVALRYGYAKTDDFSDGSFAPIPIAVFQTSQDLSYRLVLPVAGCLSARVGYQRNTELDLDYTNFFGPSAQFQSGGAYEAESLGLSGFFNLVSGAGADADRAFVPHFGRLGQLRVDFDWTRRIDMANPLYVNTVGTQSYSLAAGAPLTQSLSLGLSVSHKETDVPTAGPWANVLGPPSSQDRGSWMYDLNLSWAFGSPDSRVGR